MREKTVKLVFFIKELKKTCYYFLSFISSIPTKVPTWGIRTKYDLIHQPDFILRWKYSNLLGITNLDSGGHYLAFENPEEVARDLYRAVRRFLKRK